MDTLHNCLQKATYLLLANFASIGLNLPTVLASSTPAISPSPDLILTQVNFVPPNVGAPGSQQDPPNGGAGSRPGCPETARLVSFSPATNWGETIGNKPIFWFHTSVQFTSVEFSLWDEKGLEKLYETTVSMNSEPGVFKFRLPDDAPDLEVDRIYRWKIQASCNSSSEQNLNVNGVIVRRSNSELQAKIEGASSEERVNLYAENGFWFDTLEELAKLRCAEPENPDFAADWASLLEHPNVQLNEFADEAIACDG
jgi:Domain of Unknown Function (DUF928)